MMQTIAPQQGIDGAIRAALETHVHDELEREIAAAQQRLGETLRKAAAQIERAVLKQYDVTQDKHSITIRVRNTTEGN